jgi:hypothetical protein
VRRRREMADNEGLGNCRMRSPGHMDDHPAERVWSGTECCWACWYWGKMNGPAATYWAKTLKELNIDGWDLGNYWPDAFGGGEQGQDKALQFLEMIRELQKYAQAQLDEVNPPKVEATA